METTTDKFTLTPVGLLRFWGRSMRAPDLDPVAEVMRLSGVRGPGQSELMIRCSASIVMATPGYDYARPLLGAIYVDGRQLQDLLQPMAPDVMQALDDAKGWPALLELPLWQIGTFVHLRFCDELRAQIDGGANRPEARRALRALQELPNYDGPVTVMEHRQAHWTQKKGFLTQREYCEAMVAHYRSKGDSEAVRLWQGRLTRLAVSAGSSANPDHPSRS